MNDQEQTFHFADELDRLVDRFRSEYDLSYASIVGTLQMKAWLLCEEASEQNPDKPQS